MPTESRGRRNRNECGAVDTGGGGRASARGPNLRGKRSEFGFPSACERAAQVIVGIGVQTREAGAAQAQHGLDLVGRETTAQQTLSDPEIGDAPIGGREALRNLQALQPAGVDGDGGSRGERVVNGSGRRRQTKCGSRRQALRWCGLEQSGGVGGQERLSVEQFDPRRETIGLTACGFLVGEAGQSSAMAPIGAGGVCGIESSEVSGEGGSELRLQRGQADAEPGLQMAGAGAHNSARLMPVSAHSAEDGVVGAIEIEEDIASVAVTGEGVKEDVVTFAIAKSEKRDHSAACELRRGPDLVGGKWFTSQGVNQTNLIIIARHGGEMSAHGLQGEEESAIHDRDSNIGSGYRSLKAELFTLQKTGTSHFALTE